jgi:hypothetical protein
MCSGFGGKKNMNYEVCYYTVIFLILFFLAHFPYFEKKKKVGLCYLHAVCVSVDAPYQILNAGTNLYETWYIHHGT